MQVRLLGPVDVAVGDAVRPVPGLRRKAVLAMLALRCGQVVDTDRLVDAVWDGDPPPAAVNTLQRHISYLRGVLGGKAAIVARPPGYLLDLGDEATDLRVAERLIGQGWRSADHAGRAGHLRAALANWRGPSLMDVAGLTYLDEQARRLDALWLSTKRALIDTELALGEHAQLVPDLERLALDHPFDEQIHRQLMLALYRTGRQADALSAYHRLRRSLDGDLGIEPSQPLRDLHAGILRQDPTLDAPPPASVRVAGAGPEPPGGWPVAEGPVPRQLPADIPGFVSRDGHLHALDALLANAGQHPAVVISAISGTAGVGKTALAVHWAQRVADRFPDGQLYANLRGFDPANVPMDPADALRGFLEAFAVPAQRMPASLDGRAALYRSLLAGKRVLVVLDNARTIEQVRPLLPAAGTCLAVVTSRNQLQGLVAAHGAQPLVLDLFTTEEARQLLRHRLGRDRVAGEPDAVNEIIGGCARLPLALAVAAAHAATHPHLPLSSLATGLRDTQDVLSTLDGGDASTDVRAALGWSYQQLTYPAARLFRLLGLHPGPDLSAAAAASLAALAPPEVRPLLAELARASLIVEPTSGRYTFHDLLRAYAADLAHRTDAEECRRTATRRLLDHYLQTAHAAALLLYPSRSPSSVIAPQPEVGPEQLADHEQALAWFAAERPVLRAAIAHAADAGLDTHLWQLARTLDTYLDWRGHWHDWAN